MARFLILIVLVYLGWLLVRKIGSNRPGSEDPVSRTPPEAAPTAVEPMLQCAWCGTHVAQGQSLALSDGRRYCSVAHRDAARSVDASREAQQNPPPP